MARWVQNSQVVDVDNSSLTLLKTVRRTMRSVGLPAPASLAPSGDRLAMAINAVDTAVCRVWNAAKWDWRSRWKVLEIEPGDYPAIALPADFSEMGANPHCPGLGRPLEPISYHQLVSEIPHLAHFPLDETGTGSDLSPFTDVAEVLTELLDENRQGTPRVWAIYGRHLFWYPALSESDLTAINPDYTVLTVVFSYFGAYEDMQDAIDTGTNQVILIPDSMMPIVYNLASGYLGADLEYPAAGTYEARGEKLLMQAIAKRRQNQPDMAQFRTGTSRRGWL